MKIAIMSDSHDSVDNIKTAVKLAVKAEVSAIIHCGDFVAPFSLKLFGKPGIPVYGVFGNNDGDKVKMTEYSRTILQNVKLFNEFGEVELGGKKIAFTHYFKIANILSKTNSYDLVCFGHSHTWYCKEENNTLLLNPGEIMGKNKYPGFAMYDTDTNTISEVKI